MGQFSFAGKTVVAPAILVQSVIGKQTALSLLPFGTIMMAGASNGGSGFYRFNDMYTAQKVLRGGALLTALQNAANIGGASGFLAVVLGTKTAASLSLNSGAAVATAGDKGTWTNSISISASAGTTSGMAVTFTFPDPITNQTVVVGGQGTTYDNLAAYSALAAVIAADATMTPPSATGLPAILSLNVITDGPIQALSTTYLSGGTGTGTYTPVYSDVVAGLNLIQEEAFDIGHLVGVYDAPSQAFANARATSISPFGNLQRFIHQIRPTGTSPSYTRQINSAAVSASVSAAALAMNNFRASVIGQQFYAQNLNTGVITLQDAAPFVCGLAALVGATDAWGPASPLTRVPIPTVVDVDYPVLRTTGDMDNAILNGGMVFERIGTPAPLAVRCAQSVTTQPNDPNTGLPWILAEFSGVRASDALLANVKGAIESQSPRAIGGGNTLGQMNSIITTCVTVLEAALAAQWLTGYDRTSINIGTVNATGSDDQLVYSASITPPLNHLGITQTLLPYQAKVSLGGQVNAN